MDITLFLAHIYGPVLLAVGLGIFLSRNFYIKIYRDLDKDALAVLTFGMFSMIFGIIQVGIHNVWNTLPQIIISIIGWGMLAKGAAFMIFPKAVDKAGDYWVNKNLISIAGWATIIIGGYLSWISYFA